MEATELRIGNWVYKHTDSTIHEKQVSAIDSDGVKFRDTYFTFVNVHGVANIKPIPLTKEWLVKLGFYKEGETLLSLPKDVKDRMSGDIGKRWPSFFYNNRLNKWMDCQTRVAIEHVHQLQNLYFALTGEELNIKS